MEEIQGAEDVVLKRLWELVDEVEDGRNHAKPYVYANCFRQASEASILHLQLQLSASIRE